jgi:hypothetical protein
VESAISAVKRKLGDSVRSKTDVAMRNEVLCKILAYNLTVLIAAWYELDVAPAFGENEGGDGPVVLPVARQE